MWGVLHSEESMLLGVVSVPCHKDVIDHFCPFLTPGWLQEGMAQSKGQQTKWRDAMFFCF
jgi:hypothetical protein